MTPENTLVEIRAEIAQCTKCPLAYGRKNTVPGEGPTDAEILFIGEGPGFYENEQGKPFVGQAGKFLDELLESAGLKRDRVFITNVVKCRPPGNRDPEPTELEACATFLDRQITILNPKVIVTPGQALHGKIPPECQDQSNPWSISLGTGSTHCGNVPSSRRASPAQLETNHHGRF